MAIASGTVALWLSPLNSSASPLVDASGGGHTLVQVGTVPILLGPTRIGNFRAGDIRGDLRYYRNATARTSLSGATTWRLEFDFTPSPLAAGFMFGIGDTNADNIIIRCQSNGSITLYINDGVAVSTAAGVLRSGDDYTLIINSTGGKINIWCSLSSGTLRDQALTQVITDFSPADAAFPSNGNVWLGCYGVVPGFQPAFTLFNNVRLMSSAGTGAPTLDIASAPSAGSTTNSRTTLTWTDLSGATTNTFFKSTTNDFITAVEFAEVPNGLQTLNVYGLTQGTTYYFWREARSSFGAFMERSASVSVTTSALTAPSSFTAGTPGATSVPLTWVDGSSTDHVMLYKNTVNDSGTAVLAGAAMAGAGAFTVSGLSPETAYFFWARTVAQDGTLSAFSSVAQATTTAATVPTAPFLTRG